MTNTNCPHCSAPERRLHVHGHVPDFERIEVGNFTILERCPECEQIWVQIPYEPYASYPFWAAWPGTEGEFWKLHDKFVRALGEWHAAVIREDGLRLEGQALAAVEHWRDRTYRGFNPIDNPEFEDSREFLSSSDQLADVLEELGLRGPSDA